MTPAAILSRLTKLGVTVIAQEGKLRLEGHGRRPPRDLLDELRAHAPDVLTLLRQERGGRTFLGDALGGVFPLQRIDRDVARMPLDRFAEARLVVVVTSDVLSGPIILASDNAVLDPGERRPVYRAAELWALLGLAPEHLRQIHRVKVIFGGTVEAS